MDINQRIAWLKARLQQPLPGAEAQLRMVGRVRSMPGQIPANARPSAVLCLLYPEDAALRFLLIKRTEDGKAHSGQISFPGGRQDPWDADLRATALREAQEEVGIHSKDVDIVGGLTPLYIPVSNFHVYPFVAFAESRPRFNISQTEVADILETPVDLLLRPDTKTVVDVVSPVMPEPIRNVNAYKFANQIVWGATAMILSELETIIGEHEHGF